MTRLDDGPAILPVHIDTLPAALCAVDRWLLWNLETRDGKLTKVPYQATQPATKADATNPATWADFVTARDAYLDGKADGVGFVLGDGFFGFDADDCRDPQTGAIEAEVVNYLTLLSTYAEVSVRGRGIHAIGLGQKPGARCRTGRYELYDAGRFFCMSGYALPDLPATIEHRPAALAALYARLFPSSGNGHGPVPRSFRLVDDDDALLAKARTSKQGAAFEALMAGDTSPYGGDDSAADLALCNVLAFWTGCEASRMDRLFRRSGLMRDKWDAPRGADTYGALTIQKAIADCTDTYAGRPVPATSGPATSGSDDTIPAHWTRFDLADLSTWACEPLCPIVDGILARGTFVTVAAETQTGKTLWALSLARTLLQGGLLFGQYAVTPVTRLLYLVLEDPARRIRDRLLDTAHEFSTPLDRDRCVFLFAPGFTLTDAAMWAWLDSVIRREQHDVVILDTYQKATPGLSSFDDAQQSQILHRLANLTRSLGVTILVLEHVRKQSGGPKRRADLSIDDIKGTGGKAQNADGVILLERTPDKTHIKFQCFSKDFDRPVRILLRVAPRGSHEPKFTYAADLNQLGADAQARGAHRRTQILEAMTPGAWLSAGLLAKAAGVSASTVRHHLALLVTAGTVEDNALDGRWRRYRRLGTDSTAHSVSLTENADASDKANS